MPNVRKNHLLLFFGLLVICQVVLHIEFLDRVLSGTHLWRQSQTQNNITNFYRQDFNILNPRDMSFDSDKDNIIRYEFPIMQWSIALLYKIFGESILITRLAMLAISLWACMGMYRLIYALTRYVPVAMLTSWSFSFSPVFFYYAINPLPDILALAAIIWFLCYYVRFIRGEKYRDYLCAAAFLLLATLAKLPYLMAGIILAGHGIDVLIRKGWEKRYMSGRFLLRMVSLPLILLPALIWYYIVIPGWGTNGVLTGVFDNQISWDRFWMIFNFHWKKLLPYELLGTLNIPFFIIGLAGILTTRLRHSPYFLPILSVLLITVLYFLLEINMIDIVHDYYMMPFLPSIFVICGAGIYFIYHSKFKFLVLLLAILPVITYMNKKKAYFNYSGKTEQVLVENAEVFRKAVPKGERCILINDRSTHMFAYLVDKQGYIFYNDHLPIEWIDDMVRNYNVRYMYSDSRIIDNGPEFRPYVDSLLLDKGGVRVFKLKIP